MPKIFGLGFSKTGTTSLETALQILGYKVCKQHWQYPYTFYMQALWIHRDYDELFRIANYWDAFADTPWGGTTLYEETYKRLPDSKFILTVREPEKWYESLEKLITMFDLNIETAFDSYHAGGMYGSQYFFRHVFGIDTFAGNRQKIIEHYYQYNVGVIDFFRKRPEASFIELDFEAGDGWAKLCRFLGRDVPPLAFPHENRSATNTEYLANQMAMAQKQ